MNSREQGTEKSQTGNFPVSKRFEESASSPKSPAQMLIAVHVGVGMQYQSSE
jgi:hypothetical protein